MDCPLLPGLPADLAMLCLAKLPLDAIARGRTVSRAWASALRKYPPLGRLPQGLAAFCRGKENDNSMTWLFLSRPDLRSLVIPFFFLKGAPNDVTCIYTSRLQVIETGTTLLLVRAEPQFANGNPSMIGGSDCREIVEDGHHVQESGSLQGFDVWQMKWLNSRETPWNPMLVDRWQFATAYVGKHVYFAGGDGIAAATSAERLSLDAWTWEALPPMHKERSFHPSGFTLGGRFFVIGGEHQMMSGTLPQSGEFYDPMTNSWTLVPDMWPHELWWSFGGPQIVAVIEDVAYAIDHKLQAVLRLKMDSPSFRNIKWQMVGQLPWSELDEALIPTMACMLSVQNELWAILNTRDHDSVVFACKPHLANMGLHWDHLPFTIAPSTRSTLTRGMDITI